MNEGNDENIKITFSEIELRFTLTGWSDLVEKGWNLRYLSKIGFKILNKGHRYGPYLMGLFDLRIIKKDK